MGKIAIVDDSPDLLEILSIFLKDPHEIRTFDSGKMFLEKFRKGALDLILLDLVMPELNGYEVFERIRERDQDVPVIAVSAQAQPGEKDAAFVAGFCDYFVKPILDFETFPEAVYRHVGHCVNEPAAPA